MLCLREELLLIVMGYRVFIYLIKALECFLSGVTSRLMDLSLWVNDRWQIQRVHVLLGKVTHAHRVAMLWQWEEP